MNNYSGIKSSLNLSAVGIMSTLALSAPLQAQTLDLVESLIPTAEWVSQDNETENGLISVGVMAEHKYGVASVDFYLDGLLHSKVVQETFNPETGEYEFILSFIPSASAKKCKVNAVVNPFGVGQSNKMPELIVKV